MTDWAKKTQKELERRKDWTDEDWYAERQRMILARQQYLSSVYKHPPAETFETYRNTNKLQAISAYIALKQFFIDHLMPCDLVADQDEDGIMMFQDEEEDQTFYLQIRDGVHDDPLSLANLMFVVADGGCAGRVNKGEFAVEVVQQGYPLHGCLEQMAENKVWVKVFYHEDIEALPVEEYVKSMPWNTSYEVLEKK